MQAGRDYSEGGARTWSGRKLVSAPCCLGTTGEGGALAVGQGPF
jgi:hypothetical protein